MKISKFKQNLKYAKNVLKLFSYRMLYYKII